MPDFRFKPTEDQKALLKRKERFLFAIAGIQGGKTWLGAMWSAVQISKKPHLNGLIAAPTYKILQQSTLPKFFELFPIAKQWYKKGDNEIWIPNGGVIFCRSTDEPKHIEGMTIGWAWADEIGQMSRQAWINMQGRLSINKGNFMGTTTPYAMNWLYTDVFAPFKRGEAEDVYIHSWRSVDNPWFPKEEYERAKNSMDRRTFAKRYEGKFEKMEGLVYEEFDMDKSIFTELPPTKQIGSPFVETVIGGIDFGFTNPTAMIAAVVTRDRHWYIMDEWYEVQRTTDEIIEKQMQWISEYGIRAWYPDPEDPEKIKQINDKGIYTREVSKKVPEGINSVRQVIREGRLHIHKKCKNLIEELNIYHYAEPQGEGQEHEKPVKQQDHAVDALRYMIHSYKPQPFQNTKEMHLRRTQRRQARTRSYQYE